MTDIVPIEQIRSDLAKPPQRGTNVILGLVEQIEARDELITKLTNYHADVPDVVGKLDAIETALQMMAANIIHLSTEMLVLKALLNEKREAQP